jgi:hypothetical protein
MDLGLTQNITEHFNKKRNGKKKGGVVKRNTALENKASDSMMIPGHFNTPHVVAHSASGDSTLLTPESVYSIHFMLFPNPEQLTSEYQGNVQCYPLTPIVIAQKQIKESMQRLRAKHSLHQAGKYVYFTSEDVRNIQASDSLTFKYEDVIIHLQYSAEVEAWTWHAMQSFVSKNEVIFPSTQMLNLSSDDLNGVQNLWENHLRAQVIEVTKQGVDAGVDSPTRALGKASSGESDANGSDDEKAKASRSRSSSTSSSTSTTVHSSNADDDWLDGYNLSGGSNKSKAANGKDGGGASSGAGAKAAGGSGKGKKKKKKKK